MRKVVLFVAVTAIIVGSALPALAVSSDCEDCHATISPLMVEDFNRGVMSKTMTCADCHGEEHTSADDADKAKLPTIATCQACHEEQAEQYLAGKHAKGLLAIEVLPFTHGQPDAYIEGQKGCGGCHTLGMLDEEKRQSESRRYYKYGMDCQNCHTRHAFSKAEAQEPEACMTCHMGFDHPQWEMWSTSKHGVAYLLDREAHRGPKCQDCHMAEGNHFVRTPWGFLGVRLPEEDEEWMGLRATILMGLGVLDAEGQPTPLLDVVVAGDMARLDAETFNAERKRITNVCGKCHTPSYVNDNMVNADKMLKEADKLFAEAIIIIKDLRKDGVITVKEGEGVYPQLLSFYEVDTKVELILYEMFMDHRMKTFMGAFHINPDYTTWYGYAKMKKDLVEIKELDHHMRKAYEAEKAP